MFMQLVYVALGGALGAVLRFLAGLGGARLAIGGFPVTVIAVNILGSFLMGIFAVFFARRGMGHLSPLIMVGVLGGFTTFSAFSLEAVTLFEKGEIGAGLSYIGLSVLGSLVALGFGAWLARGIWL